MKKFERSCVRTAVVTAALAVTLASAAFAQTETIIYSFTGGSDGGEPNGGVILDAKGNLYGTAVLGGANAAGAVFELSPNAGGGWTETVLYSFNFTSGEGFLPCSGLIFDRHGNLYGETSAGGTGGAGTIFELSPGSNGAWTEKPLYSFAGGSDGYAPFTGALALDRSGNLYGVTQGGGSSGFGTVFQLVAGPEGNWSKNILYNFAQENDGGVPYAERLVLDSSGNVYGTTLQGGAHDYGVVFELVHESNGNWSEKVLHSFTGGLDGAVPQGGVTFDAAGNLYGNSYSSVLKFAPGSNGMWTENIIHTFGGGSDGSNPETVLTFDKAGHLYGATYGGGLHRGTVFELTPHANGTWTDTILHRFSASGSDGIFPFFSPVAIDSQGNVFGTTSAGGSFNAGVVFKIVP
jgi:uncharacterized repeat protein (TIGR03803 family)